MKKTFKLRARKPDPTVAVFLLSHFVGVLLGSLAYLVYARLYGKELYSAFSSYLASETPFWPLLLESLVLTYAGLLIILLSSKTRFCRALVSLYMAFVGASVGATISAAFGCLGPKGIPAVLAFLLPQTLCLLFIRLIVGKTAADLESGVKPSPRALVFTLAAAIIPVIYDTFSISMIVKKL